MFDLSGKNALVTGAASGIGEAAARTLAAAGAKVYVGDLDFTRGIAVADEISKEGFAAEFMELDVSSKSSCDAAEAYIRRTHGWLDILVNNAGIGHVGTILETTSEDLERLFAVNVRGMFDLTKGVCRRNDRTKLRSDHQHCFHRRRHCDSRSARVLHIEVRGRRVYQMPGARSRNRRYSRKLHLPRSR
jgi:NAD(P)-dependent dehydrogenase (short-subunit alcohol dehydrogenase family)